MFFILSDTLHTATRQTPRTKRPWDAPAHWHRPLRGWFGKDRRV